MKVRLVRIALRRLTQEDINSFERKEVVNHESNHEVSHEVSQEVNNEINHEVNQPVNMEGDKFEFVNLPPIEVKEE